MRLRRSLQVAAFSAVLVSPLAAFAGTVTTAPLAQPAPALAMPLLVALAITLIGLGAYRIRIRPAGMVAVGALVAGLSVLAGLGHATLIADPVIGDGACNTQTVSLYDPAGATLTSNCPNPIKIVAIDPCDSGGPTDALCDPLPSICTVNQILTNGQECELPPCCR